MPRPPPRSTLFPYTTLFRSAKGYLLAVGRPCWIPFIGIVENQLRWGAALCGQRSEEHTSELQSRFDLVCRLLLEKKKLRSQLHTNAQSPWTECEKSTVKSCL